MAVGCTNIPRRASLETQPGELWRELSRIEADVLSIQLVSFYLQATLGRRATMNGSVGP